MTSQTTCAEDFVTLDSGRTLAAKLADVVSALDYGAATTGSASANTTAINAAIAACTSGFVIIPPSVSYTEASLVMRDEVVLIIFGVNSTVTILTKNQGDGITNKGGIVIKSQGDTGALLKVTDYGVTAEPVVQICDATGADVAAIETKFLEGSEITDPAAPIADKGRLYYRDSGAGKTQLVVRFPTGAVQVLAEEP